MDARLSPLMNTGTLTTPAGDGRFPVIRLESTGGHPRTITVFGLANPLTLFQRHAIDTKAALSDAVSSFRLGDYPLVFGHAYELGALAYAKRLGRSTQWYHETVRDFTKEGLIDVYPSLRTSERFEWFTVFAFGEGETRLWERRASGSVLSLPTMLDEADPEGARRFFEDTWPDRSRVELLRKHTIDTYQATLDLSEEEATQLEQYQGRFRSFIAARTALWRAELFDIKLFVPNLWVPELIEFLTIQDAVDQYLEALEHTMQHTLSVIYANNEVMQRTATLRSMARQDQVLLPNFNRLFVGWMLNTLHEYAHGVRPAQLDFSDYRSRLLALAARTKPSEPCFCLSGVPYKDCVCSVYLDGQGSELIGDARRSRRQPRSLRKGRRERAKEKRRK